LLSVSKFAADNNVYFQFHANKCFLISQETNQIVLRGLVKNGLYSFDSIHLAQKLANDVSSHKLTTSVSKSIPSTHTLCNSISASGDSSDKSTSLSSGNVLNLWHDRLGYASFKIVKEVLNDCNIKQYFKDSEFCLSCCLGKSHKLPFVASTSVYKSPLELVYSDVWGLAPVVSTGGHVYYIHFINAYSRYTWIYM